VLSIQDLSVSYRRVPALTDVSLQVDKGQLVGLIGPNGAGKSTIVKAIAGLVKPTKGSITYGTRRITGMLPEDIVRLGVSFVPEGRHIFQTLTVSENLALGYASGRGRDPAVLAEVLEQFPALRRYYRQSASGLSGGEQQQLAIARALLSRPEMLVLDEPSLGLAPIVIDGVFGVLNRLRDDGVTILLVEQNASRTIAMAERTYVLGSGKVVAQGTSADLSSREEIAHAYLGRQHA
jgi:branched-chain amino acid transport system ATP-binding protein